MEYRLPDDVPDEKLNQLRVTDGNDSFLPSKSEGPRAQLESWLKQEGDTMGHCVGGYCDAVTSGKSRILSLRDKKGKSRATIELSPGDHRDSEYLRYLWMEDPDTDLNFDEWLKSYYPADYENGIKERIVQIKGPGNRPPDAEVLPYIQDFVKSGNWSDVSDLQNTGLYKQGDRFMSINDMNSDPGFIKWNDGTPVQLEDDSRDHVIKELYNEYQRSLIGGGI